MGVGRSFHINVKPYDHGLYQKGNDQALVRILVDLPGLGKPVVVQAKLAVCQGWTWDPAKRRVGLKLRV